MQAADARLLSGLFDGVYREGAPPLNYDRPVPSVSSVLDRDPGHYVVSSLPGLPADYHTKQWAGQIPIPYAGVDHYGGIFFWLFEPNTTDSAKTKDSPLIIWLNGGPGCSSLDGLFIENGPLRVVDLNKLEINEFAWNNEGYVLYIDQPIGTGFSYVNPECQACDYVHNQSAVNSHIFSALQSLYVVFPFLEARKTILAGESYAGHYIPAIADYFLTLNKAKGYSGSDKQVNVWSLAIGNGWSIPKIQYNFGSYANNLGILSAPDAQKLTKQYKLCVAQVERGDYSSGGSCNIIGQVLAASGACPLAESAAVAPPGKKGQHKRSDNPNGTCFGPLLNYYDTRSYYVNILSSWPANADITSQYLNQKQVMKAIHIKKMFRSYSECDDAGQYLMVLYGLGVQQQIINVLEAGIPITFYNGQYDFVCNHIGAEEMLDQLPWSGQKDFMESEGYVWVLNQTVPTSGSNAARSTVKVPAGYGRTTSDGRLRFLVVIGGSHMVIILFFYCFIALFSETVSFFYN